MAQLLEDSSFCEEFIQQCPAAVEVLNLVAQECSPGKDAQQPSVRLFCHKFPPLLSFPGERLGIVEAQCERLRMLYRDCARPPPPPLQTDRCQVSVDSFSVSAARKNKSIMTRRVFLGAS